MLQCPGEQRGPEALLSETELRIMSAEQRATAQKHVPQTPANKTDAPRHARFRSINRL